MRRPLSALGALAAALIVAVVVLVAVGGGHGSPVARSCSVPSSLAAAGAAPPGARPADPAQTSVVCTWAADEARGDFNAATTLFALPALIETPDSAGMVSVQRLTGSGAVRDFNAGLACAATPIRSVAVQSYTVVSFRLFGRPGGAPCAGVAHTAFVIRDGRITAWLRAPNDLGALRLPPADPGSGGTIPSVPASPATGGPLV